MITPGVHTPTNFEYSSTIHHIISHVVFTSGAGTSTSFQIKGVSLAANHLDNLSSSHLDKVLGSTMIHHFHHHSGIPTTEVFRLIHADRDITSSLETL
ncbi:MAG: hypothetical protein WCG25_05500 [bacterium]